uniref:DC_STAMP domain-containing protein n=1 Tax=Mesocestoides corti TaxID=53468 RepID=A0A5K3F3H6_MESCO
MTSVLVQITFVVAAIISKRFRSFLALLGPTLGLSAGQSFLAAELTSVAVHGPVRGLATNLKAAGASLTCLMKLSANITKDANKLLKPSGKQPTTDESEEEEDPDELDGGRPRPLGNNSTTFNATHVNVTKTEKSNTKSKPIKYPKLKSLSEFNHFFTKVMKKASKGITQGALGFQNLTMDVEKELLRDPEATKPPVTPQGTANQTAETNQATADVAAANDGVSEAFQRHLAEMDTSEKERMRVRKKIMQAKIDAAFQNLKLGTNDSAGIKTAVALGHKIDANMRRRLVKACMAMQQAQTEQCNKGAVTACYRIQTAAYLSTGLPLIIGPWCSSQVTKGTACPTSEALSKAKSQCDNGGYNIGLKDGFGAQFAVAQSGLQQFAESFQVATGYKKLKSAAEQASALYHDTEDAIEQLTYLTIDATNAIFALVLLASTLLKLLFVKLLLKTQGYISNYLVDMDFDNIYVEDVYEAIDERRRKQSRMYLLPLKIHERKAVFWRKRGYTGAELIRAIKDVIKASVLGIGLTLLFAADGYLHSLMTVLDVVTQGDLRLGGSSGKSDTGAAAMYLAGDGFAAEVLKGIIDGFKNMMNIDLSYKLSSCAPNVIMSSHNVKFRFGLLWAVLLILAAFSGFLLRFRHVLMGFFYPCAHRRRQMHLYNTMLANRARDLSTNRNLLVQRVKENRLQEEVRILSKPPAIADLAPSIARLLKLEKGTCIICRDVQKPGPAMYICPVDACAICRQCQSGISADPEFCVACIDRNEASIDATLKKLEQTSNSYGT